MEPTTVIGILSMVFMVLMLLMANRVEKLENKVKDMEKNTQRPRSQDMSMNVTEANTYAKPAKMVAPRRETYWSRRDVTGENF